MVLCMCRKSLYGYLVFWVSENTNDLCQGKCVKFGLVKHLHYTKNFINEANKLYFLLYIDYT